MGSGSGSDESSARTPVGSSSPAGSEPLGICGLDRLFTSMLVGESVGLPIVLPEGLSGACQDGECADEGMTSGRCHWFLRRGASGRF
jgi:hypothetical protein